MRRTTALISLAAAAALLAGCADGAGDDPTSEEPTSEAPTTEPATAEPTEEPSTEEPTAETPSDEAVDGPAFPDSTAEQTSDQTAAALLLVDVRVGEHPGYDRLVLEFEGEGEPGWRVGYVEEASTQGQGDPIQVEGDALLAVTALHTMPDDMTGYYDGPREIDPDTEVVEEVFVDGTFEGETVVVLGIDDGEQPFRVFTLTDPTRLVVDVQDPED